MKIVKMSDYSPPAHALSFFFLNLFFSSTLCDEERSRYTKVHKSERETPSVELESFFDEGLKNVLNFPAPNNTLLGELHPLRISSYER